MVRRGMDGWDEDEAETWQDEVDAQNKNATINFEKICGVQDEIYSKEELDCMHFVSKIQDATIFARNDLKNAHLKTIFKTALDGLVAATIEVKI